MANEQPTTALLNANGAIYAFKDSYGNTHPLEPQLAAQAAIDATNAAKAATDAAEAATDSAATATEAAASANQAATDAAALLPLGLYVDEDGDICQKDEG